MKKQNNPADLPIYLFKQGNNFEAYRFFGAHFDCRGGDEGKPRHCRACAIRDCCREKGLRYCLECTAFPCRRLNRLEKSYRTRYNASLLSNSRAVLTRGLAVFLENERQKYTCSVCGGIVSLHDGVCGTCGASTAALE